MRPSPLLLTVLTAMGCPTTEATVCLQVAPETTTCPAGDDVDRADLFRWGDCDEFGISWLADEGERVDLTPIDFVDTAGDNTTPACCYAAKVYDKNPQQTCVVGRPWSEGPADLVPGDGWTSAAPAPAGDADRARAWLEAAQGEHASIAAFARLALELMAHGAPADLLAATFAAGADEIRHAADCFAMAARFGADAIVPGPLSLGAGVAARPLSAVAADAVREGCLTETLGAHLAAVAAALAPDPDVAALLTAIADDEARHAALSWRVVRWALGIGGAEVREAVLGALRDLPGLDATPLAVRAGVDPAVLARAAREGVTEVLRPAARALLAA